ncbi:MAG TPA: hypothetical protein VMV01_13115 [Planctomycetota bacterium]|nr:hypothetical protein [Planctomycetota bacterium]
MTDTAFRARVRAALAAPEAGPLAARFPAPLITAIVAGADVGELERLELALTELIAGLAAVGVPRGRQFVLLGSLLPAPAGESATRLRAALGVPVLVHDSRDADFVAGASPEGAPFELDSELREAEAVVVVGPARAGPDGLEGGAGLLCPGVASLRTRAAWEAARTAGGAPSANAFALALERAVPADLAVLWQADGTVTAGEGRALFAALALRPATLDPLGTRPLD